MLRKQKRFEAFKDHIRKRDTARTAEVKMSYSQNHGDSSEAYQYSGVKHSKTGNASFKRIKH